MFFSVFGVISWIGLSVSLDHRFSEKGEVMSLLLQRPYRRIYSLLTFVATLSLIVIPFRFPTVRTFAQDKMPRLVSDQSLDTFRLKSTEPRDAYGALPLSFELNQGQTNGQVKFL